MEIPKKSHEESLAEITTRITKTFRVMEDITKGVIAGEIRSMMISGSAGCGKTYTVEKLLNEASRAEKINHRIIKGTMSAPVLYRELYDYRTEGNILVMDDCDSVFQDLEAVNILKSALDTGTRRVFWNKENKGMEADEIPQEFEFEGAAVFITNIDFDEAILRGSKMSEHYNALLSRSMYIDLGIHTKREVLARIMQVATTDEFLKIAKVSKTEAVEMCRWCAEHLRKFRHLSIRTILHLATLRRTNKTTWEDNAEVTLFNRKLY